MSNASLDLIVFTISVWNSLITGLLLYIIGELRRIDKRIAYMRGYINGLSGEPRWEE